MPERPNHRGTTPDPIYPTDTSALLAFLEPQMNRLAEAHPDAMISAHTMLGAYVAVRGSEQLLGHRAEGLLDRFAYDLMHEQDLAVVARSHKERLRGNAGSVRYRIRHADGSYVAVETTTVIARSAEHEALVCVTRRLPAT